MTDVMKFVQDAGPADWPVLPRLFGRGDVIYCFRGHTYGCDRDDMIYAGRETIPCTLKPGEHPFFTVPVEFLEDANGVQPCGGYISAKKRAALVKATKP